MKKDWFTAILQVILALLFSALLAMSSLLVVTTFFEPKLSETAVFAISAAASLLFYILISIKRLAGFFKKA